MSQIEIEIDDDGDTYATCECCGRRMPSVVGFVYRNGDAFAAYYAGWTEGHQRGVELIIGIGNWDEDAAQEDRRSFGLRCWEEEDHVNFEVQEPAASRYGQNTYLGAMMPRSAALKDPELAEVFHVAEHIAEDDPRVRAVLEGVLYLPHDQR